MLLDETFFIIWYLDSNIPFKEVHFCQNSEINGLLTFSKVLVHLNTSLDQFFKEISEHYKNVLIYQLFINSKTLRK